MFRTPTIAIVDDDEAVRTATASLVRSLGYAAQTYACAQDFLRAAPATSPDCLITDVQMPGMTGIELQERLRQEGRTLPVIVVTAFASDALHRRALASGACAFLEKPVGGDLMEHSLQVALAEGGRRQGAAVTGGA
ncbi:response regulator transcription factor [Methylobacterium sp. SyP6R]|uniref:response regulator transcription factor n=1 Tax=Methylobacterium sp. SyP6R TaxID=2718876 RepID=UPI001F022AD6|nr:response regulator [Methylobacterium sp. SyP6R]MCF4127510.1 response regulator [Methylobacterium sp. SyP6R]